MGNEREGRASILIVEDDRNLCNSIRLILEKKGFFIETVGTGLEGLEKAKERFFNVVLLDLGLPDMQGIELISSLKESHPGMDVVVITGQATLETAVRALNEGASAYVTKPMDMDDLLARIGQFVEKQTLLVENRRLYQEAQQEIAERKRAEEHFRGLAEGSIQGIIVQRNFKPLFANQAMADLIGHDSVDDVLSLDLHEVSFFVPHERKRIRNIIKARMRGENPPNRYEVQGIKKDGALFWMELLATWINWDGKPALQVTFTDITERRQAVEALRKSEDRYARAVSGTGDGLWDRNIETGEDYFSPQWQQMLGYEEGELELHDGTFEKLIHPDDRDGVNAAIAAHLEKRVPYDLEFRMICKNDDFCWVRSRGQAVWDKSGKPLRMAGSIRDITERKKAEEELLANQRLLQTVFDTLPVEIFVKDEESRFIVVNKMLAQNAGITADDFRGLSILEIPFGTEEEKKRMMEEDRLVMEKGERVEFPDVPHTYSDGVTKSWRVIKVPLRDMSGTITGLLGVREDITEQKLAEEGLRQSRELEKLAHARLMDAIEALPGSFAIYDAEERFVLCNSKTLEMFPDHAPILKPGTSYEDVLRKSAEKGLILVDPGDRENYVQRRLQEFRERPDFIEQHWADGRWFEIHHQPTSEGGTVTLRLDITERKVAEEALRENELKYRDLVETSQDMIWRNDREGRFTYLNPAWASTLGYSLEEMISHEFTEFKRPEEREQSFQRHHRTMQGDPETNYETIYITKTGEEVILEFKVKPLSDASGQIVGAQGTATDITEQKRAEEELHSSQRLLQTVFETIPVGLQVKDRSGRYLMVNPHMAALYGKSPDDFIGRTFAELRVGTETQKEQVLENDRRVIETGETTDFPEAPLLLPDGKTIWRRRIKAPLRDGEGAIIGLVGALLDVTEQKRVEEGRLRLMTAVEQTSEGVLITDSDGLIQYTNPALERITGYAREEMLGKNPRFLQSGNQDEQFYEEMWRTIVTGEVWEGSLTNRKKDGSFYEEEMTISPIRDSEGSIESFIAIKRDVTERKRAEEKIALQQAQLIQADKMASLGTLVAGVAHEINNPNAIITLNTPSLRAFWEDALPILDAHQASNGEFFLASIPYDRVRKDLPAMLEDIQGGAERIKTIVENLNNFARQGADGERSAISLNKVVKSAVVLVGAKIRKTTTRFHLALAEDLPMVEANFQEMEQVVINLLTNSCDALADMGKAITISTKYNAKAQQALIVVADEGEGISPENLSRIKEPFFTTKRDTGGTGLGLSVSHGIIENHNGRLEFISSSKRGTVATIALSTQMD